MARSIDHEADPTSKKSGSAPLSFLTFVSSSED